MVRVVAPAGPFDADRVRAGIGRLRRRYEVRFEQGLFERDGFLAGLDARRLAELQRALGDPDARAIVGARGGYGCTRLLPELALRAVRAQPKLLVGFSDLTALHATWNRAGVRSLHAPMVGGLSDLPETLFERWLGAIEGATPPTLRGLEGWTTGRADGVLVGGNLAVLAALLGTPYRPLLGGSILFLEEVGERPYRVDRMLTTMIQAGWFESLAGVVLGAFEDLPGPDGVSVQPVLRERLGALSLPVVSGVPAGHVQDNLELPFGSPVTIDASRGELVVHEPAVR